MAVKLNIPFPIFAASLSPGQIPNPNPNPNSVNFLRGPEEFRFSRWGNERFKHRCRGQEEVEADILRHRRVYADTRITDIQDTNADSGAAAFNSRRLPSLPHSPSIPSRKSKYSRLDRGHGPKLKNKPKVPDSPPQLHGKPEVKLSDDGLSYVIDGAPFEFKYSYTETPKVKPLKLREPPYAPFGPITMGRPWTGRAPLPQSQKKLREFDSFKPPPPGKKGVKPVQKPGPFLHGSGPRYAHTREDIQGEPLTKEEIKELVISCLKTRKQLNMGRDGFTHNMLNNIQELWKRQRVCKIKCKGVCTVDMDSVCEQLEEKMGGKIIYRKGGVVFLFRGRNYNNRTRSRFPLMLWKPVSPVYPRLIPRVPEGLTLEEATEMRKKGRELEPICKLSKNGVYCWLVKRVREAFEVCELVRINCQGIKGSDYRKIGAKLKDLVPCVLISFENEQILIWRGRDWKSSLSTPDLTEAQLSDVELDAENSLAEKEAVVGPSLGDEGQLRSSDEMRERVNHRCSERVLNLMEQAKEQGSALVLDASDLVDPDIVLAKAVEFAMVAPPGPFFRHGAMKHEGREEEVEGSRWEMKTGKETDSVKHEVDVRVVREKKKQVPKKKQIPEKRSDDVNGDSTDVVASLQGTLSVDELARLLA